jgi:DNA-binding MarR family transcriptional regulator
MRTNRPRSSYSNAPRALDVLAYLAQMPRGATCRKVSEDLELHRGSVSKWINVLQAKGLIEFSCHTPAGSQWAPVYVVSKMLRGE